MERTGTPKAWGLESLALLLAALCLVPFYYVIVNSVKSFADIMIRTSALPVQLHFTNYSSAWKLMNFGQVFLNSLLIVIISNLLIVVFCSMTAYKLVRTRSSVSSFIFFLFVAAMIIPFQSVMIPLIALASDLHLMNSIWGLILMYLGFGSGMAVFLYHGFVKSIPVEIEEAATIDGCSTIRMYWSIVFPLLKPITATVIILNSLWIWNDFLLPSLVLQEESLRTIPLATFYFFGQYMKKWDLALAALMLGITPLLLFYVFMQKHIVRGITSGSVK